ncbi:carbon monoxide dehydrogenase [Thiocapsa rosea]|uniref:carbon monoxide dehydrogenase n=1 Tax=Thiocapsa rosea TaxID=69360 RepID=UPI000EAF62DB|nr:carbon monoxide dehydrogenase [Thiocapsa rosea]
MSDQRQRQRHGVHKHLVEGIGGLLAGAALVLLARSILKARARPETPDTQSSPAVAPTQDQA